MNQEPSFGRFIRERRRTLDLTQEELARRVGCAAITIRKIEADDARASVQIAERLAMALGIPLDERAGFVRRARAVRPDLAESPIETPPPALEEIGREDLTGRAIRGYSLAERIGSGGMGAVYRAVQPIVEREVAMKIILPAFANHPDFIRRFEAEAQLVARLEHPHIVPLYDYWREPGVAYLVMRLLRGGSLQHLLQNGAIPLETTAKLLEQICAALHSAHRIGVIHRDLKPANILLDDDSNAYLADFGIAKNLGSPNLEDQTQADVMIGSPQYMSPEQIHSLSIRPQTDIYCLGVVLYEMLTGARPFGGPTPFDLIQQHISAPLPPLAAYRTGLPAALDRVVSRAAAKSAEDRYPDALALLEDFYHALDGTVSRRSVSSIQLSVFSAGDAQLDTEHWTLTPENNPYKGLRAFGEADAEDFFGRETLVQQLLARLGEGGELVRFLAVVGPSGSGKSSVVKAGLVPALRRGALPGSENWFIVDLMPGSHPFEEVEAALLRIAINPPSSLLEQLKENERGLVRAVRRCLPKDEAVELVLVIDQFEELFTLTRDESERALFLSCLVAAVMDERSRVRVVLTLRADFTDRPLRYVDFGELVQRRSEFVLPLTPDELERAILAPAQKVGLRMEAGLILAITRDADDQPGTLPLLQYALTELFEKREGRTLTKAAYTEIGGILVALGRRAEEIYTSLSKPEQAVARQLFLRLVTLGEGVEDTRRRVLRSELEGLLTGDRRPETSLSNPGPLSSVLRQAIDAFGKARLLTFDHDPVTRGPTVEVAHEALLREWPRLREWLNTSRGDVRLQRILGQATSEWVQANRDLGLLLRGTRLTQLEQWAKDTTLALTNDEREFLEASLEGRKQRHAVELQRQNRERGLELRSRNFLRGLVGVFAVATVIALVLSIFAFNQRGIAQNQANIAATERANAQDQANLAATNAANASQQQALAENEAQARATQQAIAEAQSALATTQQTIAEEQQALAEAQAQLAFSRELVAGSIVNIDTDPELSMLLALQALERSDSYQARQALHNAILTSRILRSSKGRPDEGFGFVVFSSDEKQIANVSFGPDWLYTQVRDAEKLDVLFTLPGLLLNGEWRDSGRWLTKDIFADPEALATIMVWDSAGNPLSTITLPFPVKDVVAYDLHPDLSQIAFSTRDGLVHIVDAENGQSLQTLEETDTIPPDWIIYSPDGKQLLSCNNAAGTATLWDIASGKTIRIRPTPFVGRCTFSRDGRQLAIADFNNAVIIDSASGQDLLKLIGHSGQILSINFSEDGSLLVTSARDGTVKIWDTETGRNLFTFELDSTTGVIEAVLSPDGTEVITTLGNGTLQSWGLTPADSKEVLTVPGTEACLTNISPGGGAAISLDGLLLAVPVCGESTVHLLDAVSGSSINTLTSPFEGEIAFPTFSPDGTRLAAIKLDRTPEDAPGDTFVVWNIATGQETLPLSGHTNRVWDVIFNPDGTHLATISYDKTARIWDTNTGETLFTLDVFVEALSVG
ncbi:MAG: protein kinase, partial [Anaerolineales bacterium]|nr:protein kinase [Anaerolineales bacterium]